MDESLTLTLRILFALWLLPAAVSCCVLAFRQRVPVRKRQLWFAATAYFGLFFVVIGVANYLEDLKAPVSFFEAKGVIIAVTPYGSGSEIQIRMAGGGVAHVNTGGDSPFFRVGEHVKAKYAAYSGTIEDAQFFSDKGLPEGTFHRSKPKFPYVLLGIGFVVIGLGWLNLWRMERQPLRL